MKVELKIGETFVAVDKGIAEVVKRLNELGFRTVSSCSGLREDHRGIRRFEGIASVDVEGRCIELTEIAEAGGWDWSLNSYVINRPDCRFYVNFFGHKGCVYKLTADAKGFRQTPSSKEEAIGSKLPFKYTSMEIEAEEPKKDEFIKRKIANLLEAIERYVQEKSI